MIRSTNSIGMKFRLIPPGEFSMGCTTEEVEEAIKLLDPGDANIKHNQDCVRSQAPRHKVILTQPIYLAVTEVTQSAYEKVMGLNPSYYSLLGKGKAAVADRDTASHPVEMLVWSEAAEFCAKLSEKEKLKPFDLRAGETRFPLMGTGYRLPSNAEWEFACRAGTTMTFWAGDDEEALRKAEWFRMNSGGRTHAAGELQANPLGLFDMHGNVCEWVQDEWEPTYYGQFQEGPALNPNGPSSTGAQRVLRRGDFSDIAFACRSSSLAGSYVWRYNNVGFRAALSVGTVQELVKSQPATLESIVVRLDTIGAKYKRQADRPDGTIVEVNAAAGLTDDDLLLLQKLPELRLLHIAGSKVTERGLPHLADFPALENLELHTSDAGLACIARLPRLKGLGISFFSPVTDAGMVEVAKLTNLEEFNVSYNNITSAGAAHLGSLKKLRVLCLNSTKVNDDGLAIVKELPALETLWLGGCPVTDAGLTHLDGHPTLSGLIAGNPNITDATAARLPSLKKLTLLWLGGAGFTDASVEHLAKIKTLGNLDLRQTGLTDDGLARLRAALPNCSIEPKAMAAADRAAAEMVLDLGGMVLIEPGGRIEKRSDLPALEFKVTEVTIANNPTTAEQMDLLARLERLRYLCLDRSQLAPEAWERLGRLRSLRWLMLAETGVTDERLALVREMKNLDLLQLEGNPIGDSGLVHLAGQTKLAVLNLSRTEISDAGLKQLASLPQTELYLSHTKITDEGVENLHGLKQLKVLRLNDTQVTDKGVAELKAALPNCNVSR